MALSSAVVWLLWILPIVIVMAAGIVIAIASFLSPRANAMPNITVLLLVLLLLVVEFVLVVIVILFGIIGAVWFARTEASVKGSGFQRSSRQ